jgi:hypothetical protein
MWPSFYATVCLILIYHDFCSAKAVSHNNFLSLQIISQRQAGVLRASKPVNDR